MNMQLHSLSDVVTRFRHLLLILTVISTLMAAIAVTGGTSGPAIAKTRSTPTPTIVSALTATATNSPTATLSPTATATATNSPTATASPRATATATIPATATLAPTGTA